MKFTLACFIVMLLAMWCQLVGLGSYQEGGKVIYTAGNIWISNVGGVAVGAVLTHLWYRTK